MAIYMYVSKCTVNVLILFSIVIHYRITKSYILLEHRSVSTV